MAPPPTRYVEPSWLEPYPDTALPDLAPGPATRYEQREATQLAFVAGLQLLPERQRAALVLRDVLGFGTEEVAAILDVTSQSVKGALRRARATLDHFGNHDGDHPLWIFPPQVLECFQDRPEELAVR